MPPRDRDRRRQGLGNRLRRLLYGALLLAASPGAIAVDPLGAVGQFRPQTAVAPVRLLQASLQGLILLHAEESPGAAAPIQGNDYPRIGLDTVSARLQPPAPHDATVLRLDISEESRLRDGVGFDLEVPDFGHFHLNLYSRRNAQTPGRRWGATLGDENSAGPRRTWSLGGTLELVRTIDGGRHLAFIPELHVDMGDNETRYLPFQASVKLANWRSLGDRTALLEVVPQIAFRWRL